MSGFDQLSTELRNAIQELGYSKPTRIQEKAFSKIPLKDTSESFSFLISAPTGSGKTEAAFFPILNNVLNIKRKESESTKGFSLLYIAPLRALNRDILSRMVPLLADKLNMSISVRNSDTNSYQRRKQALHPPEILITTPETFQILFCGKHLRNNLKSVEWIIVDEFHSIMDSKRGVQFSIGLERLRRLTSFSLIGLGAGINNERKALNFLTGGRKGEIITGGEKREYSINVKAVKPQLRVSDSPLGFDQEVRLRKITDKLARIVRNTNGKVLVFSNTRTTVELLGAFMKSDHPEINSAAHHSSLGAEVRRDVEQKFKKGALDCVIATSSLELGIDIGKCELVLQVMSPRRIEIALQRIGRSKHTAGRLAKGIIIAGTSDSLFESLGVAELSGKELEPKRIPQKSYDVLAHQIIGMLRGEYIAKEKYLTKSEVFNTITQAWPYQHLSTQEFTEILRFLDNRVGLINVNRDHLSLSSGAIPYYFQHLSTIPTVVKYDVYDVEKNEKIGELDQKFVMEIESGDIFLLSGLPREILEIKIKEGKILTRPSGASALPPKWEGELIPVSNKLAEYVGDLRRKCSNGTLLEHTSTDSTARKWAEEVVEEYPEEKTFPDTKNLVAEADASKGLVVLHFPFGTKINNTIAIFLKQFLSEDQDFPIVAVDSDAYRIFLHTFKSSFLEEESLFESLERALNKIIDYSLDKEEFKRLLYDAVINSRTSELGWHLFQILNRFGSTGAQSRMGKNQIKRLVGSYRGTPPLKEAVREYIFSHLNLEQTRKILKEIGNRRTLWFTKGLSSLALGAPSNFSTDVEDVDRLVNRKYEERLLDKKLKFVCLSCGYTEIRAARNSLQECPACPSSLISVVKRYKKLEKIVKKAKSEELSGSEKKKLSFAHKIARSLKANSTLTSKVIATTGVGAKQALALIRKHSIDPNRLLEKLRKREQNYWQYHHIWEDET